MLGLNQIIIRFFNSNINGEAVNWMFIKNHLIKKGSVCLLGRDEVVMRKVVKIAMA